MSHYMAPADVDVDQGRTVTVTWSMFAQAIRVDLHGADRAYMGADAALALASALTEYAEELNCRKIERELSDAERDEIEQAEAARQMSLESGACGS